jgi:hypothetical protein
MAELTEPMKLFIVQGLACYDTPSQVAAAVKEEFGIEVTRQQVARYDAPKATAKDLSRKLRDIFKATREAFLADVSTIPIAQQAYRLRVLQRNLNKVEGQGNVAMVTQILEQAAKESGGAFTNKTKLEHSGEIRHPELRLVLNGTQPAPSPDAGVSH